MLAWFRRQRLLAALLIAANPALVGSWVAAYHPCPVQDGAEWRRGAEAQVVPPAAAEHAGHDMMMMGEAPAPSDQAPAHDHGGSDGPCTCIGQCLMAGVALPSVAGDEASLAVVVTQHSVAGTQYLAALPAARPHHLLPPSTAPPQA